MNVTDYIETYFNLDPKPLTDLPLAVADDLRSYMEDGPDYRGAITATITPKCRVGEYEYHLDPRDIEFTTEQVEYARFQFGDMTRGMTDAQVEELALTEPAPQWNADDIEEWRLP